MNPPRPQYTVSVNAVTCLTNRGAQEQPKKKKKTNIKCHVVQFIVRTELTPLCGTVPYRYMYCWTPERNTVYLCLVCLFSDYSLESDSEFWNQWNQRVRPDILQHFCSVHIFSIHFTLCVFFKLCFLMYGQIFPFIKRPLEMRHNCKVSSHVYWVNIFGQLHH